jgi:hypothetical protein
MILFVLLTIVNFFRVLIILVAVYYVFKLVMRFVAPKVVENAANKLFQEMKNQEANQGKKTVRKGDVVIKYSGKPQKQYKRSDGDYIEFEEINDKK